MVSSALLINYHYNYSPSIVVTEDVLICHNAARVHPQGYTLLETPANWMFTSVSRLDFRVESVMYVQFIDFIPGVDVSFTKKQQLFIVKNLHGNELQPHVLALFRLIRCQSAGLFVGHSKNPVDLLQ